MSKETNLEQSLESIIERAWKEKIEVINLEAKRYQITRPIVIDSQMLEDKSLEIRGMGQGKTYLSGTMMLDCSWQIWHEHIMVTKLEKNLPIDLLYANGKQQILARYPNYQKGVALGGYAKDAVSVERARKWSDPKGGYIRALHEKEWGGNDYIITGKNEDGSLCYKWVGDNNRGSIMHPTIRMVENIFEELDAPGEWYYRKETGELFFWPPSDIDLSSARIEAAVNSLLFHLKGMDESHPVRNIKLSHLTIEKTARTMFTGLYERPLRGDWGFVRTGTILLENAEHISIQNVTFDKIGGNAVAISGYNKQHNIDTCDFTHIGATGVLVAGLLSAVRDPSTYDNNNHKTVISDFMSGPLTEEYPREITVQNSWFYDIGIFEYQAAAVNMSISSKVTVRKNTIHKTTRAGININDGTFGGHLIEGNDLFDCVTHTSDHGPINTWGRDRFWTVPQHDASGYLGREKRPFALLDAWETTILRENRIYANHGFGIDLDDGSSNYNIYNNLCIGVGIKTREGFDRSVHNNLLIGSAFDVHVSYAQNNDLFYNNIVVNQKIVCAIAINEGATTIFNNNLYWEPFSKGKDIQGWPEQDFASVVEDPMFVDFEGNDFRLCEGSPATKRGYIPFATDDLDFGRTDAPKPPRFRYIPGGAEVRMMRFFDVVLSNVDGDSMRSLAGLPDTRGVFIVNCSEDGIFTALGFPLVSGDVIRKIGDIEVNNIETFIEALDKSPLMQLVLIEIYRGQKPVEAKIRMDYRLEKQEG